MVLITPLTAGGAALLGLQSWASSLYTYNRDAFMIDIQVRQQNDYQKQNTNLSRLASSRQEVRDLMKQDIQKIGASILVTTLLLGLAGEMLFEGQIPGASPPFLLNVYILCLGSGMLYMALSILFGICASYEAFESGTRLLTQKIRIKDWNRTMLKNREDLESKQLTQAFERRQFEKVLALPLAPRIRKAWAALRGLLRRDAQERASPNRDRSLTASSGAAESRAPSRQISSESGTDCDDAVDDESWRREWVRDLEVWMPLKHCMFSCVALGTRCLLEACGYWCLGSKYGDRPASGAWAYWAVAIIFAALNVLIARFYLGFLIESRRKQLLESDSQLDEGAGFVTCRLTDLIPIILREHVPHCWATPLLQIAIEEPEKGRTGRNIQIWVLSLVPAGAPLLLILSTTSNQPVAGFSVNSILVPAGYLYHAIVTAGVGTLIYNISSNPGTGVPESYLDDLDIPINRRDSNAGLYATRDMPKTMLSLSSIMLGLLWFGAFMWACTTYTEVEEFNRHHQMVDYTVTLRDIVWNGSTDNNISVQFADGTTDNNSPYFFPHAVACPEGQKVFMANKYQVFELQVSTQGRGLVLKQLDCIVDSLIKDVAVQCNKGECFPVVLITEGSQNYLVECGSSQSKRWPLLQTQFPVSQIALRANNGSEAGWRDEAKNDLVVVVEEPVPKVRQYTFSPLHRPPGFYPWGGPLLELDGVTLHSIDLVEADALHDGNWTHDMLLLFQNSSDESTLEIWDISNGVHCGRWSIPDLDGLGPEHVVGGGCAYSAGPSMFVLFGPGSVASKLAKLSLPLGRDLKELCDREAMKQEAKTRRPGTCASRPLSSGCARTG